MARSASRAGRKMRCAGMTLARGRALASAFTPRVGEFALMFARHIQDRFIELHRRSSQLPRQVQTLLLTCETRSGAGAVLRNTSPRPTRPSHWSAATSRTGAWLSVGQGTRPFRAFTRQDGGIWHHLLANELPHLDPGREEKMCLHDAAEALT